MQQMLDSHKDFQALDFALQAALSALIGSGASYAYFLLLQRQVDSIQPTDDVPIWEAEDNVQGFARPFAIGAAAYRHVSHLLLLSFVLFYDDCCVKAVVPLVFVYIGSSYNI